ncbi:MAG: cytochrome c oxidase accessory protein CcoG, partial [Planctomycetes bacterium]|nr:cytochrome c oxidase accessory protein CcoG [Planctomycetota bacterium]
PPAGGATHADNENGTLLPPAFGERVLPTMNEDGSRRWIKPRLSHGPFHSARRIFSWVLIGIFTLVPYIRIGGHPLVLLDIPARQFTLFGRVFVPTDTLILLALLLTVFTGVFLFTAVLGRVWCGWACPQTVYLEFVFRPIERFFDNLGKRMALRPDDPKHTLFKALRWGAYTVIAMYLAHTFLAYFVGVDRLAIWVRRSPLEHPVSFLVMAGTTFAMLLDFGVFREQVCFAACPYGRLQSVLLDRQSLIIGYDKTRGEPRGKMSAAAFIAANSPEAKKGDCVDCKACVVTCPTGIDIRDGLQLECIGCTQCIDACDTIMLKLNKPKGLIRYASQDELAGKSRKLIRPRVLIYSVLMTVAASALVYLLTHDR